jgi:exodeoxyribonuclease V alpha subunit
VYANPDGNYYVYRLTDSKGNQQTVVGNMPGCSKGRKSRRKGVGSSIRITAAVLRDESQGGVADQRDGDSQVFGERRVALASAEVFADRIVDMFGVKTLEILDHYTERLREVPGIGAKRIQEIREAWRGQAEDRETRVFLQGLGISSAYCGV